MISTKTASFLAHFHCASYGNAGNQQISESVRRIVIVIVVVCRMEALGAKVIEMNADGPCFGLYTTPDAIVPCRFYSRSLSTCCAGTGSIFSSGLSSLAKNIKCCHGSLLYSRTSLNPLALYSFMIWRFDIL